MCVCVCTCMCAPHDPERRRGVGRAGSLSCHQMMLCGSAFITELFVILVLNRQECEVFSSQTHYFLRGNSPTSLLSKDPPHLYGAHPSALKLSPVCRVSLREVIFISCYVRPGRRDLIRSSVSSVTDFVFCCLK